MLKPTAKQISETWDSLPENVRETFLSDETAKKITAVCETNSIPKDKWPIIEAAVENVLLGFLKVSGLVDDLRSNLPEINELVINKVAQDLLESTFEPLRNDLRPFSGMTDSSMKKSAAEGKLKPAFAPGSPFILHAEEEIKSAPTPGAPTLTRPSFYKPSFSQYATPPTTKSEAARLELGVEETKPVEPVKVKVGNEKARVVHYSEARTPLDPFAKIPATPKAEIDKKKEVHPDNVINLKDLPL